MSKSLAVEPHTCLPHSEPFLFVDEAFIDEEMSRAITRRTFREDEVYFKGHFPGDPILPGVLLIESMAQCARLLLNVRAERVLPGFLVGVENAKFNSSVRPPQTVRFQARVVRESIISVSRSQAGRILTFKAAAYVGSERCARATLDLYQITREPPADWGQITTR